MGTLSFLADAHVNRSYVNAIRSNGFPVSWIDDPEYTLGATDESQLSRSRNEGLVIITNDDDFVELADNLDHGGLIVYQQYGHNAREIALAITRIDRYFTADAFENHIEWLENWI